MSAYSAAVLATSGLIGYWRFGEASGTTAVDASGGGHNGTLTGGVTVGTPGLLTGDADTAYLFDGVDDFIEFGDVPFWELTVGTYEAWVKTSTGSGQFRIMTEGNTAPFMMLNGKLVTYDYGSGLIRNSNITISDNVRHHVVMTFETGVTNGMNLYVDGVLGINSTVAGGLFTGHFSIGGEQFWPGVIDEPAVYNTILSPATVAAHYTAGSTVAATASSATPGLMLPI